ncbi:unnamed protein product [Bursaphelenchus xylophilus]|uniref:(pine wood nematode) hypothetical protein n=1 Tax=Bursaphelenchus xylophilus TaxID=6326 RepID=A0A1I7SSP6_BURXY|nr:unnamed protein product [Bursaphelenchus xylophilus]CAG9108927.1 unnamed protein product [Bursaphelenchus xylophilus]
MLPTVYSVDLAARSGAAALSRTQDYPRAMRLLQVGRLGAGHLPVLFAIVFTAMLGATYCFAVYHGDVDPVFPYISANGDNRPESCVFSMLLNLCALLSIVIVHLRYSLIAELNRSSNLFLKRLNGLALYLGTFGGIGMFIVANFQETAVVKVHLFGAFTCFGFGGLYMVLQAIISHLMCPLFAGRRAANIRSVLAGFSVVSFFVAVYYGVAAANEFHKFHPNDPTPRPWSHKQMHEGYELHCVSALAEWILALLNMAFILSFSRDFEKIRVDLRVNPLVGHLDQSPIWRSESDLTGASP